LSMDVELARGFEPPTG